MIFDQKHRKNNKQCWLLHIPESEESNDQYHAEIREPQDQRHDSQASEAVRVVAADGGVHPVHEAEAQAETAVHYGG